MEAVAIIGLTGNVLQFVGFGTKLVATFRDFRTSTTGLLPSHQELDKGIDSCNKLLLKLRSHVVSEDISETLQDRIEDCLDVGEEIQRKLTRYKDKHSRGMRGKMAVLRILWDEPQLDNLQERLNAITDGIKLHLSIEQKYAIEKLAQDQGELFERLDLVTQTICDNIIKGREMLQIDQVTMATQLMNLHQESEQALAARLDLLQRALQAELQQVQTMLEAQIPIRQKPRRRRLSVPTSHLLVPYKRNRNFIARSDMMEKLFDLSSLGDSSIALSGLGGVGKTQLALEFAHQYHDQHPDTWIFWIDASSFECLQEDLAEIANILGLAKSSEAIQRSSVKFQNWLRHTPESWYLFLDNVDNLTTAQPRSTYTPAEPSRLQLMQLHSPNGRILYTTRNTMDASELVENPKSVLKLGRMTEQESLSFLTKKLCITYPGEEAAQLAQTLQHIPLALAHAAAYLNIRNIRDGIVQYLRLLDDEKCKAIQLEDESLVRSILLTWHISFDRIEMQRRSAADLLAFLCNCHWREVDESLLQAYAQKTRHFHKEPPQLRLYNDVTLLISYHMLWQSQSEKRYSIQPLVHLAMRRWIDQKKSKVLEEKYFVRIATEQLPVEVYKPHRESRNIRRHVDYAFANRSETERGFEEPWAELLTRAAYLFCLEGTNMTAQKMAKWAYKKRLDLHGADDSRTLDSWRIWNRILRHLHFLDTSLDETNKCLKKHVEVFGKDHPHTYTVQSNLAAIQHLKGEYTECEATMRIILAGRINTLGDFHPETLETKMNFSMSLMQTKNLDEAERICRDTRAFFMNVLGYDHPAYIVNLKNLASILREKRKYAEAETILLEAMGKTSEILGEIDPQTMPVMNELALVLRDQGKFDEALVINEKVVEHHCNFHREDHPWTMIALNSMALTLQGQKKFSDAEKTFRRIVISLTARIGQDHPTTLRVTNNLAGLLFEQAKYAAAAELWSKVLGCSEKRLGILHRESLKLVECLAKAYYWGEQWKPAASQYKLAFERSCAALGIHCPQNGLYLSRLSEISRRLGGETVGSRWEKELAAWKAAVPREDWPENCSHEPSSRKATTAAHVMLADTPSRRWIVEACE